MKIYEVKIMRVDGKITKGTAFEFSRGCLLCGVVEKDGVETIETISKIYVRRVK